MKFIQGTKLFLRLNRFEPLDYHETSRNHVYIYIGFLLDLRLVSCLFRCKPWNDVFGFGHRTAPPLSSLDVHSRKRLRRACEI